MQTSDLQAWKYLTPKKNVSKLRDLVNNQDANTCSKSTIETLEKDVKYVLSWQKRHQSNVNGVTCYYRWLETGTCLLDKDYKSK